MLPRTYIWLLLISFFVCQACCREPDRYYHIADSSFAFIPYDSNSTFRLQDSLGHTVNTFSVEDHSLRYEYIDECAECCDNNFGQVYSLKFRGDNPAVSIQMILSQQGYNGDLRRPSLEFWLHPETLFRLSLDESDCPTIGALTCHDSLMVNGQLYEQVLEIAPDYYRYYDSTFVSRLWYSKARGILKYTTMVGQVWEVMP